MPESGKLTTKGQNTAWLVLAVICLTIARTIDSGLTAAGASSEHWPRIVAASISGLAWMWFVICVGKWWNGNVK